MLLFAWGTLFGFWAGIRLYAWFLLQPSLGGYERITELRKEREEKSKKNKCDA
jgi:hypothetical protein